MVTIQQVSLYVFDDVVNLSNNTGMLDAELA